ncbi:hypothetical protein PSACC_01973 [Paramicrosporidium saccamoebae]|uniref:Uncharacterized protein n=1 Tax=Paramicrosporidium saccamoebae TaxID=1246581 RepID=A0A2H9TKD6_9FUNG|nr:hypothetical protein PSACC_01973 [Paramicrosporidium saccamoebae]
MRLIVLMLIALVMAHEEEDPIMRAVEQALGLLQQQHRPHVEEQKTTRSKRLYKQWELFVSVTPCQYSVCVQTPTVRRYSANMKCTLVFFALLVLARASYGGYGGYDGDDGDDTYEGYGSYDDYGSMKQHEEDEDNLNLSFLDF